MLYFFGKKIRKSPKRWELRPQTPLASGGWGLRPQTPDLLLPSPVTVTFEEGVCSANVIAVNNNKKNFKIAIMFCFCPSFLISNSAQGTLANTPGVARRQRKISGGTKRKKIETYSYNFRSLRHRKCSILFSTPNAWSTQL